MPGLCLVALAVLFSAITLWPELTISQAPVNDGVWQLAAIERLADSLVNGEPFLNPWVSEWALGYPVWQSYQPLPHLLGAAFLIAFDSDVAPIVGQQVTLDDTAGAGAEARLDLLIAQDDVEQPAPACDLVAQAVVDGEPRGWCSSTR